MAVHLLNPYAYPVRQACLLKAARSLLRAEGRPRAEVSILLTDDAALHELNHQYRGFDKPTDVLSFAQNDTALGQAALPPLPHDSLLGDVVISVDTARRQAASHGVDLDSELSLLCVHGILHLLGYEDETDDGAEAMRIREIDILAPLGIPGREP